MYFLKKLYQSIEKKQLELHETGRGGKNRKQHPVSHVIQKLSSEPLSVRASQKTANKLTKPKSNKPLLSDKMIKRLKKQCAAEEKEFIMPYCRKKVEKVSVVK